MGVKYREIEYKGFTGIDISKPEIEIAPSSAVSIQNFYIRQGEMISRPPLQAILPPLPDGNSIRILDSFIDSNNVVHTVAVSYQNAYQLVQGWNVPSFSGSAWSLIGSLPGITYDIVGPYAIYLNQFYFSMGDNLLFFDGLTNAVQVACALTGPPTGLATAGCFYLGVLDFQLLMISTIESISGVDSFYTQRVRWAPSGFTTVWDPNVNTAAGYNDMLDVPDIITGYVSIGQNGYIFRTNGITEMFPTGQALLPFSWNHLWASEKGIGNVIPGAVSSYGSTAFFLSSDNVYRLTTSSFDAIGEPILDTLYADILSVTANNQITSHIVPVWKAGYVYLTYVLCLPTVNGCIWYVYNIKEQSWTRFVFTGGYPTGRINIISIS